MFTCGYIHGTEEERRKFVFLVDKTPAKRVFVHDFLWLYTWNRKRKKKVELLVVKSCLKKGCFCSSFVVVIYRKYKMKEKSCNLGLM